MKIHEIPLRFVKSFLIEMEGNRGIIVDAGTPGSGNKILNYVNSVGVKKIDYVIFTHSHQDHIGGAHELRINLDSKFCIDENGKDYLEKGLVREPVLHSTFLKFVFSIGKPFFFKRTEGVNPDMILKEGEIEEGIEIIKTPGHTSDSISIFLRDLNAVIVGDTLQGTRQGLRYPSIYEKFDELKKSVEKIKSLSSSMIYVSHGVSSNKFLV
ncbi:MBL fold metallo-hydrolase [Acidianus manzaensis]|uniref:MBL fold metallo-hydrolase n=1 Tax=Acidianus manzaensis TaxID=282676 RepID=A0A1W6K3S5_9CREN|nr:MBL fold metallo-hydrolase [Acidianus manzaensis]ARM77193.1 MBL fold metallo-hydrolase [Acidianus manzaensis]